MLTLAIDPGSAKLAWAIGDANQDNKLLGFELIKNVEGLKDHALAYWYAQQMPFSHKTVVERSHFFKGESIFLLQDLLDVNIVAGYIAGIRQGTLMSVAGWRRGQVPKKVQLNRTFKRLRSDELVKLGNPKNYDDVDPNIMDAVGILFAVTGRMNDDL